LREQHYYVKAGYVMKKENQPELREMTGAELKSMLKSSIQFKSLGGVKHSGLKLGDAELKWWRDAKFGMFIHWGLYSILGRGEWAMQNEQIPVEEYEKLAGEFAPGHFDAEQWAKLARDAGMKYMVLTARHHDGFSLWDSPGSYRGFTSMNSAAKRDFVDEYTEACRGAGLKVGLYYSPMDWRFPGYFKPHELPENALLMKKQAYDQVEELVSRYGKIDILWYDGAWLAHQGGDPDGAWLWEPVKLNRMVRKYNPGTVINPRSGWEGDFYCDEGSHEITGGIIPVPWEKNLCICSGRSWGWIPDDPVMLFDAAIRMMVNVFIRDGNVLLNVGPDKDGVIPEAAAERLKEIGEWMEQFGESVYSTRGGPFQPLDHVYGSTYAENRIYLHILDCKEFAKLELPPIPQKINHCGLLDGDCIPFVRTATGIKITISHEAEKPDTIIVLELDEPVEFDFVENITFTGK
jgi:alpha-L-fucosidase